MFTQSCLFFFFLLIQFHRQRDFCLKLHFFYYYFLGDRGEEGEGATAPSQDFEGLWHKWTKPKSSQLPGFAHLIVPTAAQAALGPVPISPYASFVPRINYLSTKSIQPFPSSLWPLCDIREQSSDKYSCICLVSLKHSSLHFMCLFFF